MSIALAKAYPLEQWHKVCTLFIEKELRNPDINHLHCIMLFEADWQLLLKWHLSYGFLPKTEEAGTLIAAQGGGRKGCSAIDQATQQVVETKSFTWNSNHLLTLIWISMHALTSLLKLVTTLLANNTEWTMCTLNSMCIHINSCDIMFGINLAFPQTMIHLRAIHGMELVKELQMQPCNTLPFLIH